MAGAGLAAAPGGRDGTSPAISNPSRPLSSRAQTLLVKASLCSLRSIPQSWRGKFKIKTPPHHTHTPKKKKKKEKGEEAERLGWAAPGEGSGLPSSSGPGASCWGCCCLKKSGGRGVPRKLALSHPALEMTPQVTEQRLASPGPDPRPLCKRGHREGWGRGGGRVLGSDPLLLFNVFLNKIITPPQPLPVSGSPHPKPEGEEIKKSKNGDSELPAAVSEEALSCLSLSEGDGDGVGGDIGHCHFT